MDMQDIIHMDFCLFSLASYLWIINQSKWIIFFPFIFDETQVYSLHIQHLKLQPVEAMKRVNFIGDSKKLQGI